MAGLLQTAPHGDDTLSQRVAFHQKLQAVTNKVHATSNTDELMVELSHEICDLFDADRLTIYVISEDTNSIVSKYNRCRVTAGARSYSLNNFVKRSVSPFDVAILRAR